MSNEVSSTGGMGYSSRADERAYINFEYGLDAQHAQQFTDEIKIHLFDETRHAAGTTRMVGRIVAQNAVLCDVLEANPDLRNNIEAAAPVPDAKYGPESLVYFSNNIGSRKLSSVQRDSFTNAIQDARRAPKFSINADETLATNGVRMTNRIESPAELEALVGKTFGWDLGGCEQFAARIEEQRLWRPWQRNDWFAGITTREENRLIACVMAERLDVPTPSGQLALIEHTEWSVDESYRGRGLGTVAVRALLQRLQADLATERHLIFSETNILSHAHIVALRSGFEVSEISFNGVRPRQLIENNVRVGDGCEPPGQYRTFVLSTGAKIC